MTILVKDIVGSETAIAYDDGVKCLDLVLESLEKDGSVELDFQGVEFVITAFLNPVIGDIIDKIKIVKDGALIKREDLEE